MFRTMWRLQMNKKLRENVMNRANERLFIDWTRSIKEAKESYQQFRQRKRRVTDLWARANGNSAAFASDRPGWWLSWKTPISTALYSSDRMRRIRRICP